MENLKTTFITTIFNEEKTLPEFLTSIYKQTVLPDEIIIVDAGSHDNSRIIIQKYFNEYPGIPAKLLVKKGNRSAGRNEAIRHATHEIILCSDAGCILDENWIKNLLEKFHKKSISVVSGYYKPLTVNVFEKSLATYTCVMPDRINELEFLPSSRSIAFTKNSWKTVNGYPEYLDTCEDLVFAKKLKDAGFHFLFARHAFVYWPQRKNMLQAFLQFFHYAQGDGKALYIRPQVFFLFLRYIILILLLFFLIPQPQLLFYTCISLAVLYSLWSIGKNYYYINDWKALYYLPLLQITADFAVLWGTTTGLIEYIMLRNKTKKVLQFSERRNSNIK